MIRLLVSSACLSWLAACASAPSHPTPQNDASAQCSTASPPGVVVEVEDIHFDGETLFTRVLVGTLERGRVCLDKRFLPHASVKLESVRECETGATPALLPVDDVPAPPREEDFLQLAPGAWYGAQLRFPLFSAQRGVPGTNCVDVRVSVLPACGPVLATLNFRANRDLEPAAPTGSAP